MIKTSEDTASKTEEKLNLKQEKFCQLYSGQGDSDKDFFGNEAQCYLEVYSLTDEYTGKSISYQTAMVNASRLLTKAKIIARINDLLEAGGFNDENVDKQHLFLINQHADLKTKMQAIKEFNAVKSRVTKKLDITTGGQPITGMKIINESDGNSIQDTEQKTGTSG